MGAGRGNRGSARSYMRQCPEDETVAWPRMISHVNGETWSALGDRLKTEPTGPADGMVQRRDREGSRMTPRCLA